MIGTVMRFKLKKTLVGIATLSMLSPMASHADVSPGKWIFDGFSRSTRDGQGSTCVGAGGDTHAFDAPHCGDASTQSQQSRQAVHADKKAAAEAAAAARAQAKADAQAKLTGGHKDGGVLRPDGSRLRDGYGRDCVRNGSGIVVSGDCSVPSTASAGSAGMSAATAAAAATAPVAPGSELAPGSKGAYVTRPIGTEVRDGYGRSCIKDGRWSPGLATENCDPGLFSAWRSTQQPEMELAKRIQMPPPQVPWPPAAPAPAANVAADTGSAAAPIEAPKGDAPVVDTALPVFPITKYEFSPEEEESAALLDGDDDDDATDDIAADGAALADDDEDGVAMMADETEDEGIPEAEPMVAEDDDDADSAVAMADDDDDDDDGSDGMTAFAGDDLMRDDENLALAELGDDGEADDTPDDGEPDLLAADDTDDGEPDLFAEDDAPRVDESSLAPRIKQAPPEVARSSQTVVAAAAPAAAQSPAEFPVTKYEYDPNSSSGSLTSSDAAANSALAAAATDDADALADADDEAAPAAVAATEQEYTDIPRPGDMLAASDRELPSDAKPEPLPALTDPSDVAPPKDTPKVDSGGAKPAEPKPVAAAHSPEVSCPPTTIQLEPGRFDFDKWVLRPQAKEKLDAVAAKLKDNRCEAINIIGHTDRIGSSKYNQRLSERRANAAKAYLVKKHGIAENLITAIGKGESELITKAADCKGKRKKALIACYGPDRRVEVTVRTK